MTAPPFKLTPSIILAYAGVERLIGRLEGLGGLKPQPLLRKRNRIRTIHGSVGIEGNTLSIGDVTALLDGKRVLGSVREVREVENAIAAYERAPELSFTSEKDLLAAHGLLMRGLATDAGRYRTGSVGIWHGSKVAHVAPPASRVPALMRSLFAWARRASEPRVIVACVVHYELQFIHPFSDGNGRIGRLWQHVGLLSVSEAFSFAPVESIIRERQQRYYNALRRSDLAGDCTSFLEFSLAGLETSLAEVIQRVRPQREDAEARLEKARSHFGREWFSRSAYLGLHPRLSTATASRDLQSGVNEAMLDRRGDRRLAEYRFRGRR